MEKMDGKMKELNGKMKELNGKMETGFKVLHGKSTCNLILALFLEEIEKLTMMISHNSVSFS
jgi:hypothetical protein